jgi:hypothetical protein
MYSGSLEGKLSPDALIAIQPSNFFSRPEPFGIAFSPNGTRLAVGFSDRAAVGLLDGRTLAPLPSPNLRGIEGRDLNAVGWSEDGSTLFAAGRYGMDERLVLAWSDAGAGARRVLPAGHDLVMSLVPLPEGDLLVAAGDPWLARLQQDGTARWIHRPHKADFRDQTNTLSVSNDGTLIDFGFQKFGKVPARFDLEARKLGLDPPPDGRTSAPRHEGLSINGWRNSKVPTLNGRPLKLEPYEDARSLAVHTAGDRFVLGANYFLRAFDANGTQLWKKPAPGAVWSVNITGDGRLVIAAYDDGTIRWHRMTDGVELLAFMPLPDRTNWIAWTPEGFHGATPGAFGVLRWQVNRGWDAAAETVPVDAIPRLRRPEALALVLQEMETTRALGIADVIATRRDVQIATRSTKAPGARLHVLAIGISDYGEKAPNLKLNFAERDARDVANALLNTQEGGLYAEVKPIFLPDGEADKTGIFEALAAMDRNMTSSAGQDLAVVMFSGHGTMIDNQFYLVPYGADDSTMARLKASAIPATEFKSEIEKLARHGRVLVLLDACRSAGLIGGPANALPAAETLRAVMNTGNVTVLTSSSADKVSREDEKWGHGAFTKTLLDALSDSDVDSNRDGVISMSDLTAYLAKRLTELTSGDQQLGLDQRFEGDIFVAGL